MNCPKCGDSTDVAVSGKIDDGTLIRQRDCCNPACGYSYTTIETSLGDNPTKAKLCRTLIALGDAARGFAITMIGLGHIPAFGAQDPDESLPLAALEMRRLLKALVETRSLTDELQSLASEKGKIDELPIL